MVGPDGMVVAVARGSGVPGLALAHAPTSQGWVLVHRASGLAVSRSAKHQDPEVLVALARRLAPLADWTQQAIPIPGPMLRREIDRAVKEAGLVPLPRSRMSGDRQWSTEQDRELLARVLRRVHTAVPPGMFANAIEDLDAEERAHLRALLTDQLADTGAVVQSLPRSESQPPTATQPVPVPVPKSGSAAS
jgi:hypothetical protein